jgi:aryl-alcohol dehydrogenase-like predicted oxidoreductase
MNYRTFGNTDLLVSEIGFGAWTIGGPAFAGSIPIGWGDTNDGVSLKALQTAFANGINFYDTADFYGLGHSEELIGQVFGNNPDVIIASKVGHRLDAEDNIQLDYSYDYILHACERSLKRLQRETIDYYQLHTARVPDLENGECIRAMQDLKKAGKIRYWGISLNTYQPEPECNHALQNAIGNGFQVVLNIINQIFLPLLPDSSDHGFGIIARMPLQFGLLTGRFNKESRFSNDDHRATRLNPEILELAEEYLSPVWEVAKKYNTTPGALALRFVLSFKEVSTVIPGIRNDKQVIQNISDLDTIEDSDVQFLRDLYTEHLSILLKKMQQFG